MLKAWLDLISTIIVILVLLLVLLIAPHERQTKSNTTDALKQEWEVKISQLAPEDYKELTACVFKERPDYEIACAYVSRASWCEFITKEPYLLPIKPPCLIYKPESIPEEDKNPN